MRAIYEKKKAEMYTDFGCSKEDWDEEVVNGD